MLKQWNIPPGNENSALSKYPIYVNISVKNFMSVYLSAYLHEILITNIKEKRGQPFYTFLMPS